MGGTEKILLGGLKKIMEEASTPEPPTFHQDNMRKVN